MKIYLSPSTQENNIGAGTFGTEEEYCNIVADKVQELLESYNIDIVRNQPIMSVESIVSHSNVEKVNLHVAIHTNANLGQSRGCEVFCYRFESEGNQLALSIYERLSKLTPTLDRGVKEGMNFYGAGKHMYELAYTDAPAVLIEIDFHDNIESAKWLIRNTDKIAKGIVDGILEHIGINDDYIKKSEVISICEGIINSMRG